MKHLRLNYGEDAIAVPAAALASGAGELELRLLLLFCSGRVYREKDENELAGLLSCTPEEISRAIAFWRESGVVCDPESDTESGRSAIKAAPAEKLPVYSGLQLEQVLEKEKTLKLVIDECQKLTGNIFTPTEAGKVAAMHGELGLCSEHIMLMFCYYSEKFKAEGKRLTVAYIEKTAYVLYNDGIDTLEKFEKYVKDQEAYGSITGRMRRLFGVGDRSFTKTEKSYHTKWIKDWQMPYELIEYAYDITVDAKGKLIYPYMSKILSDFHDENITTLEAAEARTDGYRSKLKEEREKSGQSFGSDVKSSFDSQEFFDRALKRSYDAMKKVIDRKNEE